MQERIRNSDQKSPILLRNTLVAHSVAHILDRSVGQGLAPDGHKLLKRLVVKLCRGKKISISQDLPPVYQGANLQIEVEGQEHIPPAGPTIFIGNHTRGGPLNSIGQYFEVAKVGYSARPQVEDEDVREPFLIMQKGLGQGKLVQFFSGIFYDLAAYSFGAEVVAIPQYDKKGEITNKQNLGEGAMQRVVEGGALLWYPQGTHRHPEDLKFPQKANGFLKGVDIKNPYVNLVPVRAIPNQEGHMRITFGKPVDISDVVKNGGIDYFTQNHLAPLK